VIAPHFSIKFVESFGSIFVAISGRRVSVFFKIKPVASLISRE